jgi:antitoxin MazE
MVVAVKKWGNSLGVRIPKKIASKIDLYEGNEIELSVKNDTINIKKAKPKETLESILSGITKDNKHQEIQTDTVGKEL